MLMQIAGAAKICLQYLSQLLLEVCKNPSQPGFNHYLFESVAALIRYSASQDAARVGELEQQLFPAFNTVLQNDVQVCVHVCCLCQVAWMVHALQWCTAACMYASDPR